jgi:hypothetical protein
MRGLRSFIGLLAVLIALGAYLYFVESKRDPLDTGEKREKVFAVEADAIEEVSVKAESGERTTLRKSGSDWQLVEPSAAPADATEISGITSNLARLEEERLVEENPGNLADFGLAEPRIEVGFKAGSNEGRLLIGSKTPTGADLYAKTAASPRVFLVASYLESTFNRKPFDLRDKTALSFDREAADALEVETAGRTLSFAKKDGAWQIVQPEGGRSDSAAIEGLLSRLSTLQMKSIAEAPGATGLEKPVATVRVGTGSSQATLLVGGPAEEGAVYARDASRPAVFTIEASLLEDLKKDAAEYRQKDIFDARAFNTTAIDIEKGTEKLTFAKKDDKWQQSSPAAKEADAAKVDTLLSSLTSARADSFVEALPARATSEAIVTLTSDEGRKGEKVTFFRSGAEAFAQREGSSGAARIGSDVLDGILKAIEAVRQ